MYRANSSSSLFPARPWKQAFVSMTNGLLMAESSLSKASKTIEHFCSREGPLHQWGSEFALKRHLLINPVWPNALAHPINISKKMQGVLDDDGLVMLHRSKWRCLARSYSRGIERLVTLMEHFYPDSAPGELIEPLKLLKLAVRQGMSCMDAYIIPRTDRHSWLVNKALRLAMSTDVVDVHLHHFLWVLSTVLEQVLMGITEFAELQALQNHVALQTEELHAIWKNVDANQDLHIAELTLQSLAGESQTSAELIDFAFKRLSHIEKDLPHNHDSLPPYMCIDSNQCRHKENIYSDWRIDVDEVVWQGGHFALKCFKRGVDEVSFKREAAIQARLCHSHVVPLVCCTQGPLQGLLMERMQHNLYAFISENYKAFSLFDAVDLMLQIAKGMEYLHTDTLRIIHRDLKSHNIFVSSPENTVRGCKVHLKIADFGVSKAKQDCSVYTTRDQGTVLWMAPEVYGVEGDSNASEASNVLPRYSNMADVYSFGMVCFEILTGGELPFVGPVRDVRTRVLEGDRPTLPRNCPPALSSLIEMCWDKEPNKRPTFTQICRMLCYFKACIFLKHEAQHNADCHGEAAPNHDCHDQPENVDCHGEALNNEAQHNNWQLSRKIPPNIYAHNIDDMIDFCLQGGRGLILTPRPLSIPTEMLFYGVAVHKPEFVDDLGSLYNMEKAAFEAMSR